jgi:hypothetical protein
MAEVFGIERGWRQDVALSKTMFNIALEEMIRNIKTNLNGTIFKRTRLYVAYTDDVVMVRRSLRATEVVVVVVVVTQITESAVSTGLVISESKIKYIKINTNIANSENTL